MKTFSDFGIDTRGRSGEIDAICPECSSSRKKKNVKCLSVNTDKETWLCQHCGWTGSLKQGGMKSQESHWRRPVYIKPNINLTQHAPAPFGDFFKKRGITQAVLMRNNIRFGKVYMPQVEDFVDAWAFPYYRRADLINIKWRDEKKNFRGEVGAERILYGLNDIESTTIICEGELDKLSLEVAGFKNSVSVPDGAPPENAKDYSSKFTWLEDPNLGKVQNWILAVDNDGPGKKLEEELLRRLGRENCQKAIWPDGCKDANDVLVKYGIETLKKRIISAEAYPIVGVFGLDDVEDSLDRILIEGWPKGISTGWLNLDQNFTVIPGQLTVVTGIPSHGKSEFLDALTINLSLEAGWTFGIYSPENYPLENHLAKLIEKFLGRRLNSGTARSLYGEAKDWIRSHFKFIMPDDTGIDHILELGKALVRRYGIKGLILDPWNELDHRRPSGMNETEYVSECLSKVRKFARSNGVHVFFVAHPMKLQKDKTGEYPVPTPYDISGSAHWRNKADNCLAIWRNLTQPNIPVEIHIQKVRFSWVGKPGMISLNYDGTTTRYL